MRDRSLTGAVLFRYIMMVGCISIWLTSCSLRASSIGVVSSSSIFFSTSNTEAAVWNTKTLCPLATTFWPLVAPDFAKISYDYIGVSSEKERYWLAAASGWFGFFLLLLAASACCYCCWMPFEALVSTIITSSVPVEAGCGSWLYALKSSSSTFKPASSRARFSPIRERLSSASISSS